jgi:hypothetical protein
MSENNLGESPAIDELPLPATTEADADVVNEEGAEPSAAKPEPAPEDKIQKRFDKLTKEKYEALRERDRLRWELEQARQPAKTEPVAPELPTLEGAGFDDAKYQAALLEYSKATARAEVERILSEREQQQTSKAAASEFDKRQAEFAKQTPDYAEKVTENTSLPISKQMADVIRKSEIGPQIAYYLAEHEDTAALIAQMRDPLDVGRELGRIEARLETPKTAPTKVSQAPPPPSKLEANDPSPPVRTTDASGDRLSDDEWVRLERKRLAKR